MSSIKSTTIVVPFAIMHLSHNWSKTCGGRAFSTAAPQLWNTIPEYAKNADNVATFKTKLKTFLFRKYFHWFLSLTFIFFVLYKFLFRVSVVLMRVVFQTSFTVVISYPLMMMIEDHRNINFPSYRWLLILKKFSLVVMINCWNKFAVQFVQ